MLTRIYRFQMECRHILFFFLENQTLPDIFWFFESQRNAKIVQCNDDIKLCEK